MTNEQKAPAVLGPVERQVRPRFWVRRDQVQKAQHGGYLCAMYPNTDGRTDLQPMYDQAALDAEVSMDRDSRGMFVARLENMQTNGDKWLTVEAVLALLNDCDMLAQRPNVL